MSILNVVGLKKILGAQQILDGADLRVERGEKVGCVGRNGEGKTTLLRIVTGEEHAEEGSVTVSKGARVGYVPQRPNFAPGVVVRTFVEQGLAEVKKVEAELERVGEAMGEAEGDALEALMQRHGELTERMDFLDGWESERRVETVLSGIGLAEKLWEREARTLSGGEKSRTAMARELVSVPDLMLLDEPTNHLDLSGIEWIEDYLRQIASAVYVVSHDRRLLDSLCETIVEVERGQLTRYPGNYTKYVALKEERFEFEHRAWKAQQDLIRREESFIKKHMGSQRTAEAKGRQKKLSHIVRLKQPYNDVRKPIIKLAKVERGGEEVLSTENLAVGHGTTKLLEKVTVRIGRGERIGIVGPNGSGKTTLLKALAGRAQPMDGEIKRGYKAACGFYDQETIDLRDDSTPFLEIKRDHPLMTDQEIRSHLALFLFRGDDVDLEVRGLSGGERGRLALARLVLTNPSWLALDEPTNHLDLPGRTALEEMLGGFPGALVCISHDRAFLDRLVHTIIEVKHGSVRTFRGNYSDYKAVLDEEADQVVAERERGKEREKERARNEAKAREKKKAKGNGQPKKSGSAKKNKQKANPWKLERLEKAIMELEAKRDALLEKLSSEAVYKDPQALRDAQFELADVERDLSETNLQWEEMI